MQAVIVKIFFTLSSVHIVKGFFTVSAVKVCSDCPQESRSNRLKNLKKKC